jgi:hypothetical protein
MSIVPVLLLTTSLTLQGCTAAAVAYGVSKMTEPKAQSPQPPLRSPELRTYPEYVTEMERINLEREKAGLQPRPIMTQEEWASAQKAGSPPASPPSPAPPAESPGKVGETKE